MILFFLGINITYLFIFTFHDYNRPPLQVEKHDRTILVSRCAAVTPGGWITGGGFGRFSPALGLGVDNVLEMKVTENY